MTRREKIEEVYRKWRKTPGARRALGLESPRTQTYVGFLAGYRAALRGKR